MLASMKWVEFGEQGWVRVNGLTDDSGREFVALAKTVEAQGRRVVMDLVLVGEPWPPGITSAVLKAMPVGWLESMVNTPDAIALLASRDDGNPRSDETSEALRRRLNSYFEKVLPFAADEPPTLTRPNGVNPEGFYQIVAANYLSAVRTSQRPAAVLAEQAGVPVATVHRWIAETRRRGLLPPARKGRAG